MTPAVLLSKAYKQFAMVVMSGIAEAIEWSIH